MSIYFFHLTEEGDGQLRDAEGTEHEDLEAARRNAVSGVRSLIADAVMRGEHNYQGRLDVEDTDGRPVFSVRFGCPVTIESLAA